MPAVMEKLRKNEFQGRLLERRIKLIGNQIENEPMKEPEEENKKRQAKQKDEEE